MRLKSPQSGTNIFSLISKVLWRDKRFRISILTLRNVHWPWNWNRRKHSFTYLYSINKVVLKSFLFLFFKHGQNRGKIIFLQTVPCLLAGGSSLRSFAYRAWSLTWFSYSIKQNARKQINLMVFSTD